LCLARARAALLDSKEYKFSLAHAATCKKSPRVFSFSAGKSRAIFATTTRADQHRKGVSRKRLDIGGTYLRVSRYVTISGVRTLLEI